MNNSVLLYSSGLDSYFAREYLFKHDYKFDCLYFNHGGKYCFNEIKRINLSPFNIIIKEDIKLKDIEKDDAYIPNRNILFSIMLNSYGYDKVYIGGTKSDRIADNNKEIFDKLSEFMTILNGKYFIITSPFWDVYKTDVINWFFKQRILNSNQFDIAMELLTRTFSCYNPLDLDRNMKFSIETGTFSYLTEECMNCPACFRKNVELFSIGIFVPFYNISTIKKYQNEIELSIHLNTRMEATLRYINALKDRQII